MSTPRPRRSVLYMPGSNARALEKARTLPADALILDLEDAVAPDAKEEARAMVAEAVREKRFGKREVAIRINGLETDWGLDDLRAACEAGPDAILVPKVNGPGLIQEIDALMENAGAAETVEIWAMMETPRGVLHAEAIAAASPRLTCFILGTNDLVKEMNASHTEMRLPVVTALGLCLLAARAYEVAVIDGVYNSIKDEEGFAAACRQSLEMGFDGRTLIHPKQIDPCNQTFAPSEADLDLARRQIEAFKEASDQGKAVAVVDGRIVEGLHAENAQRLVDLAAAIEALQAD